MRHRRKVLENKYEGLWDYLALNIYRTGTKEIKGKEFSLFLRESNPTVSINDESSIPLEYKKISYTCDKKALKECLMNGESVPGATLETEGFKLRVK
jgi:hypothetical protein